MPALASLDDQFRQQANEEHLKTGGKKQKGYGQQIIELLLRDATHKNSISHPSHQPKK